MLLYYYYLFFVKTVVVGGLDYSCVYVCGLMMSLRDTKRTKVASSSKHQFCSLRGGFWVVGREEKSIMGLEKKSN